MRAGDKSCPQSRPPAWHPAENKECPESRGAATISRAGNDQFLAGQLKLIRNCLFQALRGMLPALAQGLAVRSCILGMAEGCEPGVGSRKGFGVQEGGGH